eukprot:1195119-Lingulodinium_polyedra.AAC.1
MGRSRGKGGGQQQGGGGRQPGGARLFSSPSQGQLMAAQRKLDNFVAKFTNKFDAISKKVEAVIGI